MFFKARLALLGTFLVHGLIVSTWASRLPVIQAHHGITSGLLGLVLLCSAFGAVSAIAVTGKIMSQFGSRMVCIVSSLLFCLVLPFLAFSPSPLWLGVTLFFYGFIAGTMDIAMNAQAVYLEKCYNRSIMVAFHALFSLGGMMGAVIGSFVASRGIPALEHFTGAAFAFAVMTGIAARFIPCDAPCQTEIDKDLAKKRIFAPFSWPLAALCIIGFCCFLSEGAIIDWSGIYLFRGLHADESIAALGYAFFSIAMTGGRLAGDSVTDRYGASNIVLIACLCAALGMGLVLLSPGISLALAGFTITGVGLSVIVPLVFGSAGFIGGNATANLTTITLFCYSAFLLGPPAIGVLADHVGLRLALALIVVLALISAFFSRTAFQSRNIRRVVPDNGLKAP
jgi:MFS family permease